jgi:hypothetical protein
MTPQDTPLTSAIIDNYLAKLDKVNPDGSTCEDIERDLTEPIAELERSLAAAQALLRRFLDFHMEPAGLTKEIVDDKDAFMAFLERADTAQLSLLKDTRFFLAPHEGERDD